MATHGTSIVNQIVDRCHVSETPRQVIRYFISRLKHKRKTWLGASREDRKVWLRLIVARHRENRALFRSVGGGQ